MGAFYLPCSDRPAPASSRRGQGTPRISAEQVLQASPSYCWGDCWPFNASGDVRVNHLHNRQRHARMRLASLLCYLPSHDSIFHSFIQSYRKASSVTEAVDTSGNVELVCRPTTEFVVFGFNYFFLFPLSTVHRCQGTREKHKVLQLTSFA